MPERIQRKRTKGWRMPENAVYVGRPTRWGNPYAVGDPGIPDRAAAVATFKRLLELRQRDPALPSAELFSGQGIPEYPSADEIRLKLWGRNLACWCPLDQPCHADVLLKLASEETADAR
jgi:hypothetical protein